MFFVIFWTALVRYTWLSNSSRFFSDNQYFRMFLVSMADIIGCFPAPPLNHAPAVWAQRCGAGGCRREAKWIAQFIALYPTSWHFTFAILPLSPAPLEPSPRSRWFTSTRRAPFARIACGRSPRPRGVWRPRRRWTTSFVRGVSWWKPLVTRGDWWRAMNIAWKSYKIDITVLFFFAGGWDSACKRNGGGGA